MIVKVRLYFVLLLMSVFPVLAQNTDKAYNSFMPGQIWKDNTGTHINAHGGGILYHNGKYYWFGEHKGENSNAAFVGVTCYSSDDLYNWKNEGVALPVVENDENSPIVKGCTIERPKVIYNTKTKKFVMYFHLELKGKGYSAAQTGVAVSDKVTGPYKFLKSLRVNAGYWPQNMTAAKRSSVVKPSDFEKWWTPEWIEAVKDGLYVRRDFDGGQMSRDMTLFVDDDGKAYHIYSSEENLTMHLAELSDDYLGYTGKYIRIEPAGHNEAPAIFKKDGRYFMITSGCTGWEPNAARLLMADNIWGPWELHPNPCKGKDSHLTFHSQSTYILPLTGRKDSYIFIADRWTPKNPVDGRYVWLPIQFEGSLPVLRWLDEWSLDFFDASGQKIKNKEKDPGWKLVWSDEFDYEGQPDPAVWSHENGFVRNNEHQWYRPENAVCKNGCLTIYGRKEKVENTRYIAESPDWRKNRKYAEYTSSCIKTIGKKEFQYGRFEIRAKIPVASGAWPAIWTLGSSMEWPSCGEIDVMEYYQVKGEPHILANTAWGTDKRFDAAWNSVKIPFSIFTAKDNTWADKFHIWRMDWDKDAIRLFIDDELVNEALLENTYNGIPGEKKNPFRQPHYLLLNLAIGGDNGGIPDDKAFPLKYEIDYVRVYQKE